MLEILMKKFNGIRISHSTKISSTDDKCQGNSQMRVQYGPERPMKSSWSSKATITVHTPQWANTKKTISNVEKDVKQLEHSATGTQHLLLMGG